MSECALHPNAIRCSHFNGEHIVMTPTLWPSIHEITYGYDSRSGSITSPCSAAMKDAAFEQMEQRWLFRKETVGE